jgi:hypothetical protein
MTSDPNAALLTALGCLGLKPRDTAKILSTLKAEFGVTAEVDGGMLILSQTGTLMNPAAALTSYAKKHPLDFYGLSPDEVKFKTDLPDVSAKSAYISKFGQRAWNDLPYNAKSPSAANVVSPTIPHVGMTAAQYKTLTVAEKSRLCGEIGYKAIEAILARR